MKNSTLQICFGRIGFLVLFLFVSGCFAHKVHSPILTTQEHLEITAKLKTAVVAVEYPKKEPEKYMVDELVDNLRKTGLFQEVGDRDKLTSTSDLVLASLEIAETDFRQACSLGFEGGMFTIGTIGLIPQICHSDHVISFKLSRIGENIEGSGRNM